MATEYDPEDLYQDTERAEIETWLAACEENKDIPKERGGPGFSDWELEFLESVRTRYDARPDAQRPLSGKQLASLRRMYDKT